MSVPFVLVCIIRGSDMWEEKKTRRIWENHTVAVWNNAVQHKTYNDNFNFSFKVKVEGATPRTRATLILRLMRQLPQSPRSKVTPVSKMYFKLREPSSHPLPLINFQIVGNYLVLLGIFVAQRTLVRRNFFKELICKFLMLK